MTKPSDSTATLKARIAERLKALDITERAASMAALGQPDTLRYLRTRGTMPSPPKLVAIASVLQCSIGYLLGTESEPNGPVTGQRDLAHIHKEAAGLSRFIPVKRAIAAHRMNLAEEIEFPGSLMAINGHDVIDQILRPPALSAQRDIYCFYNPIAEMEPAVELGAPVLIDSDRPPAIGDLALIFLRAQPDGFYGLCILRRLLGRTDERLTVQHYTPDTTFDINSAVVTGVQKVLTMADILGA